MDIAVFGLYFKDELYCITETSRHFIELLCFETATASLPHVTRAHVTWHILSSAHTPITKFNEMMHVFLWYNLIYL